jgi:hypothetical protein
VQKRILQSLLRMESKQETRLTGPSDGMDIVKTEVLKWLFPSPQPINNTARIVSSVSQQTDYKTTSSVSQQTDITSVSQGTNTTGSRKM